MRRLRQRALTVGLAVVPATVASCAPRWNAPRPEQLQAWVVYFDIEAGMAELQQHGMLFDRVSLFAYELDPRGSPGLAPRLDETITPFLQLAREEGFEPWVTVVNDIRYTPDSAIAKDGDLVHDLIADPTRRARHARDLAAVVSTHGFKGLHLDYERVPESDSTQFQQFVEELRTELRSLGCMLEVVMEPSSDALPHLGRTSVTVMAYDLFGEHTGPGPRSTPTFISELSRKTGINGDNSAAVALAVSGFAWKPDGKVQSLDWSVARRLGNEAHGTRRRDPNYVLHATLDDGTEIWFEDAESILAKWQAAWQAGFRRLAIWRLGGNDESLFDLFRRMRPDTP
jgi:spore germination protein